MHCSALGCWHRGEEGQSAFRSCRVAVRGLQAFADRLPELAVKSCAWLLSTPQ
jgi:hypothetical protein